MSKKFAILIVSVFLFLTSGCYSTLLTGVAGSVAKEAKDKKHEQMAMIQQHNVIMNQPDEEEQEFKSKFRENYKELYGIYPDESVVDEAYINYLETKDKLTATQNDGNGSANVNPRQEDSICLKCNGTGTIIETGNALGMHGKKYCEDCRQYVPLDHYHVPCPDCHGTGRQTEARSNSAQY